MLTLNYVAPNSTVVIEGSRSINIDDDVLEIIEEFKATAAYKNIKLELIGLGKFFAARKVAN